MSRAADPAWTFTQATPEDSSAMRELARSAYRPYVERMGREPAPMTANYEEIAGSGEAVLVRDGGTLLGMLVIRSEGKGLLVENIAVAPGVQGSGLGSALLAEAERIAACRGKEWVRLYTNEAMTENLTFYPRRGYQETTRATEGGYRRVHFRKSIIGR